MQKQYLLFSNVEDHIFWDYLKYLFTPEDSQESLFNASENGKNHYAGMGKAIFWLGISVLTAFAVARIFS